MESATESDAMLHKVASGYNSRRSSILPESIITFNYPEDPLETPESEEWVPLLLDSVADLVKRAAEGT